MAFWVNVQDVAVLDVAGSAEEVLRACSIPRTNEDAAYFLQQGWREMRDRCCELCGNGVETPGDFLRFIRISTCPLQFSYQV